VKPDIAVPPEQALQTAYADALRKIVADTKAPDQREQLAKLLERVEKGEPEKVDYSRM
jgi:hypothetical protein